MIKYYPLTRIITNLYTRGGEFKLPDGSFYTGKYYLTYDNQAYTGISPVLGTNIALTPTVGSVATSTNQVVYLASKSQNTQRTVTREDVELTELVPYYPVPLDSDYTRGYFTRYFAKNVTGPQYIFEISKLDWTKIQNGNVSPDMLAYETVDMLWQLTGPLNDTRVSQYQVQGGVYDTNKRVTESKAKGFSGLIAFIGGNYTKFAKITP